MLTRLPPSGLAELLLSVLLRGAWPGGAAVICPGGSSTGVLERLRDRGRAGVDGSRWELWETLDLSDHRGALSSEELANTANPRSEKEVRDVEQEVNGLLTRHLSHGHSSVVLLGSDPECIAAVLRGAGTWAGRVLWILGNPLTPDTLSSIGTPAGLLAYGQSARQHLTSYIRDALQLVGHAINTAINATPDLALVHNTVTCFDTASKPEAPSSGQYLSR